MEQRESNANEHTHGQTQFLKIRKGKIRKQGKAGLKEIKSNMAEINPNSPVIIIK